ncbi:MAG TPA: phosphatase PAP2 family protein [Steroidobacter sp.]|jgi:undecaprenyl-diphosphatase|nr:phosphatase PAP2 family protein [Steroidobacter sp.]
MESVADLIARHAIIALSAATAATLIAAAAFWRGLARFGPRSWSLAVALWNAARATSLAGRVRRFPVAGPLLGRALAAARYLGLIATLGFLLAAGAVVLFVEVVDEIGVGESLAEFDVVLSGALREHLDHETLRVFSIITHLGDPEFLMGLSVVVGALLLLRRRWLLAGAWATAIISGGLLIRLLKTIFQRSRPLHDHGLAAAHSWSFPSGHAAGSMLVYGLIAYLIVRHAPAKWHLPAALTSAALIVFVGSSRVLLQVHYMSDVLAGYFSAAAWAAIWIAGLEAVRWRSMRSL